MRDEKPAHVIARQIGRRAFFMLGADGSIMSTNEGRALCFRVKGSRRVNAVRVELCGDDTYEVKFRKVGTARNDYKMTEVSEFTGIHADQIHKLIERETGLATSL